MKHKPTRLLAVVVLALRAVASLHGNDERLSIAGIGKFVELVYRAVIDTAAAK